jgi:hypothetical protein
MRVHRSAGAALLALLVVIGLPLPGEGQQFSVCDPGLLLPASRISGLLIQDTNGNRLIDAGEPRLSGATLDLKDAGTGATLATTQTGVQGDFSFTVTPPGSYDVAVRLDPKQVVTQLTLGSSGHARVVDGHLRVALAPGESAPGLLLLLRSLAGPGISGRVLRDSDGNCQVGTSDLPLGDVPVRLLDAAGQTVAATTTMDDGRYFFAAPPAGHSYLVTPALPALPLPGAGGQAAGGAILIRALQAGTDYPQNQFLTRPPGGDGGPASIEGFVLATGAGGRSGQPVAGAIVLLRDASNQLRDWSSTGTDGNFRIEGLPIGTYTLQQLAQPGYTAVSAQAGQNGAMVDAQTLRVAMVPNLAEYSGYQFVDQVGISPDSANTISGTVTGGVGGTAGPRAGVVLVLEQLLPATGDTDPCRPLGGGRGVAVATTDPAGQYRFTDIPGGIYRVVLVPAPGTPGGDATAGPNATKIDAQTVQITTVPGLATYVANDFHLP